MSREDLIAARTVMLHDMECSSRECEPHTMIVWRRRAEAEFVEKDRVALDHIQTILSGNEWDSDTTEAIYAEVVATGREILPLPEDEGES